MRQNTACNFIKKKTLAQVFSCEFCEISKNTLSTEHIWATASSLTKGHYISAATLLWNAFKPSEKYFLCSKVKQKANKNLNAKIVQRKDTSPWRLHYWAYWSLTMEKTKNEATTNVIIHYLHSLNANFSSYRNQPIDLLCKSVYCFLYNDNFVV